MKYFFGNSLELTKLKKYLQGRIMFKDVSDFY